MRNIELMKRGTDQPSDRRAIRLRLNCSPRAAARRTCPPPLPLPPNSNAAGYGHLQYSYILYVVLGGTWISITCPLLDLCSQSGPRASCVHDFVSALHNIDHKLTVPRQRAAEGFQSPAQPNVECEGRHRTLSVRTMSPKCRPPQLHAA